MQHHVSEGIPLDDLFPFPEVLRPNLPQLKNRSGYI